MSLFERNYFVESKVSNYKDYRLKKFRNLMIDLIEILGLRKCDTILDAGCATGGLLNEFWKNGYKNIWGFDVSKWSVNWGRKNYPDLKTRLLWGNVSISKDVVLCLDVLEHLDGDDLEAFLESVRVGLSGYMVVRIPVSKAEGENYVLDVSRNDKTHLEPHCKGWWEKKLMDNGFELVRTVRKPTIYDSEGVFVGVFKKKEGIE